MCLSNLEYHGPEKKPGDKVYKRVRRKDKGFITAYRSVPVKLGQVQERGKSRSIWAMVGGRYPTGIHVLPTRDAARRYGGYNALTIQGTLVGKVVAKGTQNEQPVLVVTAVRWERVVR